MSTIKVGDLPADHAPLAGDTVVLCKASDSSVNRSTVSEILSTGSPGTGTVTSVGFTVPSWLSVSPATITTIGTFALTAATGQTQNMVLATPNGSSGALAVRALVAADLPTHNQAWSTITATPTTIAGYGITNALVTTNNLNDLNNTATARTNLGLGSAALVNTGTLLQVSNNLNDLANAATARTNLGLTSAATMTLPVSVANGGTGLNNEFNVANFFGAYSLSAEGGGNGNTDYIGKSAARAGQLGFAFYGGQGPFMYFANSTTAGAWVGNAFTFPTGIQEIGSFNHMSSDPATCGIVIWDMYGNPACYNTGANEDAIVQLRNWSINPNNSGSGWGIAIMGGNDGTGKATIIDSVGCSFNHVPFNRIKAIIPGNSMLVFNKNATHNKGFAICGPGIGGIDNGNFSLLYCDFINHLFRVPKFVADTYQPTDAGWKDAFTIDPITGNINAGVDTSVFTFKGTRWALDAGVAIDANPTAGTGFNVDATGNMNVNNSSNTGVSRWGRVIINAASTNASPGVTVGVSGGGHGIFCPSDGLTIAVSNCGANTVAKWYDGGPANNSSFGSYVHTPTWNSGGTVFTAYLMNITDTASSAGSLLLDLQIVGLGSRHSIAKSGAISIQGTQVVSTRNTGWTAWTGTATKTSIATGAATTQNCAEAIKAIIDALIAHGLIGT